MGLGNILHNLEDCILNLDPLFTNLPQSKRNDEFVFFTPLKACPETIKKIEYHLLKIKGSHIFILSKIMKWSGTSLQC